MTKNKHASQKTIVKNRLVKITAIIILISLAAFFIVSNFLIPTNEPNNELDSAMNNRNSYTFQKEGELIFINNSGETIKKIDVEIADDDLQRELGLMMRRKMEEDQGMLFLFDRENPQSFWMKNTILSLDILYVNSNREIVKIIKNAVPYSEDSLPSIKPAQFVVEVIAGFTQKYGIKEGDKVAWIRD